MTDQEDSGFKWRNRRRAVWLIILWSLGSLSYLLYEGGGDAVHNTLALAISGMLISVIGSYIFGAVWDDKR